MQQVSRSKALFWCGHEPSRAQEQAAFARSTIAEIADLVEKTGKRIVIGFSRSADPRLNELKNAIFVLQQLEEVLEKWPEYWDEEYMAEMAEEDSP
jgi:hypothetical protein